MKTIGIAVAALGVLIIFLSSALAYNAAHRNAQLFLASHPELQNVAFAVVKVPLNNGRVGRLIIDPRTGQPTRGHYLLEFSDLGVLETSEHDAVAKTVSAGYFDLSHVPGWLLALSLVMVCGGLVAVARQPKKSFAKGA